jgi:hypothetical protein
MAILPRARRKWIHPEQGSLLNQEGSEPGRTRRKSSKPVNISLPSHRCAHCEALQRPKKPFSALGSGRKNISKELLLGHCAPLLIEGATMSISKTIVLIVKIVLFIEETMLSIGKAMLLVK